MKNNHLIFLLLLYPFSCSVPVEDNNIYIEFSHSLDSLEAPAKVYFYNYTHGATEFEWDFGDSTSASAEFEPYHLFERPGDYEVTLIASSKIRNKSLTKMISITDTIPGDPVVIAPPAELGLDPFYRKYIDAHGIPVISSEQVPDEALIRVMLMANRMLDSIPLIRDKMIQYRARIGVMSKDEEPPDIPDA